MKNMKCFVIGKKALVILCSAVVVMFAAVLSPIGASVMTAAAKRDLPIYCVDKDKKVVSLSFDAAWGNEDTQQLIDILGKYNIRATFFVVGGWVDKYPESVKALHDAGHEIMNHSNTHPHMPQLSAGKMLEEANLCSDKIEKVTGVRPRLFRPPYGDYDDKVVSTLRTGGYYTIQWDVDSLDWMNKGTQNVINRVTTKVQPGSIVLFHNAAKDTPPALSTIIDYLIKEGYEFVPISELIYYEDYTIDHAGKQISNKKTDEGKKNESVPWGTGKISVEPAVLH